MLRRFLKRWVKQKEGTTAIEFSLLSIPFLLLTLGIIELSIMFTTASIVEGATASTARLLRTGAIQQAAGDPQDQEALFRDALCFNAFAFVNCQEVVIEVLNMGAFGSYDDNMAEFDEDGNLIQQGFDAGGTSDVLLVRTGFRYQMMTPLVGPLLNGPDGARVFVSTVVLQTEPYEFEGS